MKFKFNLDFLLIVLLLSVAIYAAPRAGTDVDKMYTNEGNTRTDIYVSLSSTSWTSVLSVNAKRRNAVLHTLSSASYTVCLSSSNTSATTCSATKAGIHLEPGQTYTDYSEAVLYGRVFAAGTATAIYGMEFKDSAD